MSSLENRDLSMLRKRFTYTKTGDIIYTSNLDLQKIWERACRRAEIPISYSLGFHPQAKIQQAAPLPLGFLSRTEIVDIWMDGDNNFTDLQKRINLALPNGLEVFRIETVDLNAPALQNQITSSTYQIELPSGTVKETIEQKVQDLLKTNELLVVKRGKTINIRERIESIDLAENDTKDQLLLVMQLTQRSGLSGRPDDVLNILGINPFLSNIERIKLIISED
jgi:radical SAM-linked protein